MVQWPRNQDYGGLLWGQLQAHDALCLQVGHARQRSNLCNCFFGEKERIGACAARRALHIKISREQATKPFAHSTAKTTHHGRERNREREAGNHARHRDCGRTALMPGALYGQHHQRRSLRVP